MAGAQRLGLMYFSLDVDFFQDRKIKALRARFGSDGIVFYLFILCETYRDEGYYLKIDKDFTEVAAAELNISCEKIGLMLKFLLDRSMLIEIGTPSSTDKFYSSHGIQVRYQKAKNACARKTPIPIKEGFWLLSKEETKDFIKVRSKNNLSGKNDDFSWKDELFSRKNDTNRKIDKEIDREIEERNKGNIDIDFTSAASAENDTDFTVETVDNFFEPVPFQKISNTDVVQAMSLFHSMFPEDGADDVEIAEWMTEFMRCPPGEIRERLESAKKNGETDWKGVRAWLLG